jgi:hypothetical protein
MPGKRKRNLERSRDEVRGLVSGFSVGVTIGQVTLLMLLLFEMPVEWVLVCSLLMMLAANIWAIKMDDVDRRDREGS